MAAAQLLAGLIVITVCHPQPGVWLDVTPGAVRPVFGSPVMPSLYRGPVVPPHPARGLIQRPLLPAVGRPTPVPYSTGVPPRASHPRLPLGDVGYQSYHNPAALYARSSRLGELSEPQQAALSEAGPVQEVVASGSAPIGEGDRQAARQMAVQQALRNALEKVVGVYVTGTTVAEKFAVLQDRVYVHSEGFVVPGEIIEETADQGVVTVRLRARVTLRPLVSRLRELGLTRAWRVGVSIREGAGATMSGAPPIANAAIVERLLRAGFQVIQLPPDAADRAAAEGDPAVDVLITGTAMAALTTRMQVTSGGRVLGTIPLYQSRVDARAVRVETGEVIASHTEDDVVSDPVDSLAAGTAVQLAAARVARGFVSDIATLPASATRRVRVEVQGFESRSRAQELEEALALIPGVRGVRRDEYTEGVLAVEVTADVACAERLGTDLERAPGLQAFGLTVTTDTKARIRAQVSAGH